MGSFAGPESPKPWIQRTKLRAMGRPDCGKEDGFFGNKRRMRIEMVSVVVKSTIGFTIQSIGFSSGVVHPDETIYKPKALNN